MKTVDIEGINLFEDDWLIKAREKMIEKLRIENIEYIRKPKPWEVLSRSFVGHEYKNPIYITHICEM
jgi:hypothetical protein